MDERRSGDGGVPDRRVARSAGDEPAVELLLAAVVRARAVGDGGAEGRAVAAFRAARDEGAHAIGTARPRRCDDWRPRKRRRAGRSLRTTLAVLLPSLTLGGVAFAGIGTVPDDVEADQGTPSPSSSATPDRSWPVQSRHPGAVAASGHPSRAKDTEAHCRAYTVVKGRGSAMSSTAWQRLVDAAGGEDDVKAYCAAVRSETGTAKPSRSPDRTDGTGKTDETGRTDNASNGPSTPKASKTSGTSRTSKAAPKPLPRKSRNKG